MNASTKRIALAVLRWGIAVAGIWYVVVNMSLHDHVLLLPDDGKTPVWVTLAEKAGEDSPRFTIVDHETGKNVTVDRSRVINPATMSGSAKPPKLNARIDGQVEQVTLLGMRLLGDINRNPIVEQLLVQSPRESRTRWIKPGNVVGGYRLDVPRPRVEVGIIRMVGGADPKLLWAAVMIFPITFIITSYRWHRLLRALDINMSLGRAFVINMVGAFYNSFMPGSTGGDVLKAYYTSKQTQHRTRAVVSVLIDRVIGLLALVMLGGTMAAYQYLSAPSLNDPVARACMQVALACVAVLVGTGVGMAILFQPTVRWWLGLEFILNRLPAQRQVENAREATRIYRRRPLLILWALLITVPVHLTVIVSALLAGRAFDLPIRSLYYFTAVPVIVLVGSIPISPQGAGVMEFFAIQLTQRQGATVSQAFALTMSIRVVQILWNLTGGILVLRGGYHAPSESEQRELEQQETNRVTH